MHKPIPTKYEGVVYRSRLEARWALFFDKIGFSPFYEPFTVERNGLSWTPDFILHSGISIYKPSDYTLIEIKPTRPNSDYIEYLTKMHDPRKSDILICVGSPTLEQPNGVHIRNHNNKTQVNLSGFAGIRCPECGLYTINDYSLAKDGYGFTSCVHHAGTGYNKQIAEEAKYYRFDL